MRAYLGNDVKQSSEDVRVVVRHLVLYYWCEAFQPKATVNVLLGKWLQTSIRLPAKRGGIAFLINNTNELHFNRLRPPLHARFHLTWSLKGVMTKINVRQLSTSSQILLFDQSNKHKTRRCTQSCWRTGDCCQMLDPQARNLRLKEGLYRIQILCRRHPFWSYPAGLTIAEVSRSVCTPLSPSLFTPRQIIYSPSLTISVLQPCCAVITEYGPNHTAANRQCS